MINIACAYRVNGGDWEQCDDEFWLGPNEAYHEDAKKQALDDVASSGGGDVEFRYETWTEDPTWELPGEVIAYCVEYPEEGEAYTVESAEAALRDIFDSSNEEHGVPVRVSRMVRLNTYGHHSTTVPSSTI